MKVKLYLCGDEKPISEYPLGLGYLKTNCNAEIEIVKDKSELKNCDLVGLSSSADGLIEAIDILKQSDVPVIIGGQGCLWEGIKDFDFKHIVVGEGELAFQEIVDGKTLDKFVRGKQIENIDILKFPDIGLCGKIIPVLSSRGCPWSCKFCSSSKYWQGTRFHSTDYFMEHIKHIGKVYPQAKEIYILDDLFIAKKKRFYEIAEKWMANGLNKKYTLNAFIRSNMLDLEIAKAMKAMGFRIVRFGGESGSDRMLKILNKKATVADHQNAIDICNSINLTIAASFMYDMPEETEEDKKATKDFIRKNKRKLKVHGWYKYRSFPGTEFYNGENPLKESMECRKGL